MHKDNLRYNASGCKDLTACEAIQHITQEEKEQQRKIGELLQVLKYIINKSGFELAGRIVLKDKRGKEYR